MSLSGTQLVNALSWRRNVDIRYDTEVIQHPDFLIY
uniref:Uncharacterized protein n=1 Tax=Nelumbo nucifera TaxID=4432 RepID=A0A822ZI30_NELNU|nr:TPA_asm: hypothetical protein HUJ06_001249 [Nelumbo nucifera]